MQDSLLINDRTPIHAGDGGLLVLTGQTISTDYMHRDEFELIFVKHGTLHLFEGSERSSVGENQTYLVWPNAPHGILLTDDDDVSFYWVLFGTRTVTAGNAQEPTRVPKTATMAQPERLLELLHRFLDDLGNERLTPLMGSHLVALMLCEIHRAANSAEQTRGRLEGLVDSVQVYIAKHYHESISTSAVAADLNYNPDYLERVFRTGTSMSITEAIHRKRIKEARRQLIHEYRNISEVAYACGFSDSGYFRRVFKRHTDMTPTKFRSLYCQVHLKVG